MEKINKSFIIKQGNVNITERTFEGYAATWDKDQVDDIIHPGAFTKSINEAFPAGKIKVLWQHNHFEPIGMPIEMREDTYGLWVKAKVSNTRLGDEALELMNDGVVDKMSIGFTIPMGKSEYDPENGIRHIREAKLMEFSPVTFPANEGAVITGVKAIEDALKSGVKIDNKEAFIKSLFNIKELCNPGEPCNLDTHSKNDGEPSQIDTQTAQEFKDIMGSFSDTIQTLKGN